MQVAARRATDARVDRGALRVELLEGNVLPSAPCRVGNSRLKPVELPPARLPPRPSSTCSSGAEARSRCLSL